MKEMLADIVTPLVASPSEININERVSDDGVIILELSVAKEDMGKVIGRRGKIAKAIRTVMKAAAIKAGKKISVEII